MYSKQEAFDIVYVKLLEQGCCASDGLVCLYRDAKGNKCAIGHLIPDELYLKGFEGQDAISVLAILSELVEGEDQEDQYFYLEIQHIHDRLLLLEGPEFRQPFKEKMKRLAETYELEWKYNVQ